VVEELQDRPSKELGESSVPSVEDELIQAIKEGRISPRIRSMIGILPIDMDVDAARMEYLREKYLKSTAGD